MYIYIYIYIYICLLGQRWRGRPYKSPVPRPSLPNPRPPEMTPRPVTANPWGVWERCHVSASSPGRLSAHMMRNEPRGSPR